MFINPNSSPLSIIELSSNNLLEYSVLFAFIASNLGTSNKGKVNGSKGRFVIDKIAIAFFKASPN